MLTRALLTLVGILSAALACDRQTFEEIKTPPKSITPEAGSFWPEAEITFKWESAPTASVDSVLFILDEREPVEFSDGTSQITLQPTDGLTLGTHCWAAVAKNEFERYSGKRNCFEIVTGHTLSSPDDGICLSTPTPTLDWTGTQWATGYRAEISTAPSFGTITQDSGVIAGLTYDVTTLPMGRYYWRVGGIDSTGRTFYTAVRSFVIAGLAAPTIGTATETSVDWSDVSGGNPDVTYEIDASSDSAFGTILTSGTATTTSFTFTPPLPTGGTTYIRVRAVLFGCPGPYDTAIVSCTGTPPAVVITGPSSVTCGTTTTSVTLTFDQDVSGVIADDTVSVDNGASISSLTGGPQVYTVNLAGLASGTTYTVSTLVSGLLGGSIAGICGDIPLVDETFTVDVTQDTAPTAIVNDFYTALPCGATTANALVTFDQPVSGVVAADTITITGGTASISSIIGGPTVYNVSLTGLNTATSFTLSVKPTGPSNSIRELDCLVLLAAQVDVPFTVSSGTIPSVTISGLTTPYPCGTTTTSATLTFSEPVTGVIANDTVTIGGGATISSVTGGPTVYTANISGLYDGGSFTLNVVITGPSSTIRSDPCGILLGMAKNSSFSVASSTGSPRLAITPSPNYYFGSVTVGSCISQTFTVTPLGTPPVTGVSGSVSGSGFTFLGGSYPGTGGTCGASISAPCTIVVQFCPTSTCGYFGTCSLPHTGTCSTLSANVSLGGSGGTVGPTPAPCTPTIIEYVSATTGNDANPGTSAAAPKQTINSAYAAIGTGQGEIRVAEGTYNEALAAVSSPCFRLYGGYDTTFAVRDPVAHPTIMQANRDGSAVPYGVIHMDYRTIHLDGMHIINTNPSSGYGIYYYQGSTVISNNIMESNDKTIYMWQHSCGSIHDNVISGGAAGMYFWQSKIPIYNNRITGTATGVTCWQNQGMLFDNNVVIGTSGPGFRNWQNSNFSVQRNIIRGSSYGVDGWQNSGNVTYKNNYIYGGSYGISEGAGSSLTASNNTICAPTYGIYISTTPSVITNNLIFGPTGTGTGIYAWSPYPPQSVQNNIVFSMTTLFSNGTTYSTPAAWNALNGTELTSYPSGCTPGFDCWHARYTGNGTSALAPTAVFVDVDGTDALISTDEDNDWHLLTSDVTITQGGKDASLLTCGTPEAPTHCGNVTVDKDGLSRTVPFSVGAHEK